MPSRRRSANKNIGNNIAEVNRRLRFLERRPIKTKLGLKSVTGANVANSAITSDQVAFGTNIVTTDTNLVTAVENPKDGLVVTNPETGKTSVYSEDYSSYIPITDLTAGTYASAAYDAANTAQVKADLSFTTASGKNRIFYASSQTDLNAQVTAASYTLKTGDLWFDTANGYQMAKYTEGSGWGKFELGDLAISGITAGKINAGELNLSSKGITIKGNLGADALSSMTIDGNGISIINKSGIKTFSVDTDGNAEFGGKLTAGISIEAPVIKGGSIESNSTIKGATITGSSFQTELGISGGTIAVGLVGYKNQIIFYNYTGEAAASITPFYSEAGVEGIVIHSGSDPSLGFNQDSDGVAIQWVGRNNLDIQYKNEVPVLSIQIGGYLRLYKVIGQAWNDNFSSFPTGDFRMRNISYGNTTGTPTQTPTNSGIGEGDIYLQW